MFTKCSLTKGFQYRYNDKDSKRKDDEFCQQQERKPPIWYDDVPWDGYRNDFYNLLMNETGGPIYIKEIALELLIGFIIALLIEICIVV